MRNQKSNDCLLTHRILKTGSQNNNIKKSHVTLLQQVDLQSAGESDETNRATALDCDQVLVQSLETAAASSLQFHTVRLSVQSPE